MPSNPPLGEFEAAVKWFRNRVTMTEAEYQALTARARRKAFTVAGVKQLDVVQDVFNALEKAIADGTPLNAFKAEVGEKLRRAWGGTVARPGHRLETIYRTNVQQAYAAGRYWQMTQPSVLKSRPFWMYDSVMDSRTSSICQIRNGVIRPADDVWWQSNYPPLHHRCRSGVRALTRLDANKRGITDEPPSDGVDTEFGLLPDAGEWLPNPNKYQIQLWNAFGIKLGGRPRLKVSTPFTPNLHSELSDEQTTKVLEAIKDAKLEGFFTAKPLERLAIIPNWTTGNAGLNISSGLTLPPGSDVYPAIYIRAIARKDWIPMGEEVLRAGLSDGVAVVDSVIGYMKSVLVHEAGHHIIFEAGLGIPALIQAVYAKGKPISKYAAANFEEYFCETLTAYTYYRKALKKFDPIGYTLIVEVLKLLEGAYG